MILRAFWQDEAGQDLIEYSLLLAFICLISAAILPFGGMDSVLSIGRKVQCWLVKAVEVS